jgi:hypothetical protein
MFIIYKPPHNIHYIFWTGGFDSTFAIIYFLYFSSTNIQPIYIIDECVDNTECDGRKNVSYEVNSMNKIRKTLNNSRLLPTLYVNNIELSKDVMCKSKKAYIDGFGTRLQNQYSYIAQVCQNFNINGIVSIIKSPNDIWNTKLLPQLININTSDVQITDNTSLYYRLRFPFITYDKKDLLDTASKFGFDHILRMTWSCWYPQKNGSSCKKCHMCKERII